jgi:hypothetical protein
VPELGNVTQARNVPEIEVMARDLIEIMTDTTDFAMDIQLQLPPEVEQHRRRAAELRTEELRIRSEAAAEDCGSSAAPARACAPRRGNPARRLDRAGWTTRGHRPLARSCLIHSQGEPTALNHTEYA